MASIVHILCREKRPLYVMYYFIQCINDGFWETFCCIHFKYNYYQRYFSGSHKCFYILNEIKLNGELFSSTKTLHSISKSCFRAPKRKNSSFGTMWHDKMIWEFNIKYWVKTEQTELVGLNWKLLLLLLIVKSYQLDESFQLTESIWSSFESVYRYCVYRLPKTVRPSVAVAFSSAPPMHCWLYHWMLQKFFLIPMPHCSKRWFFALGQSHLIIFYDVIKIHASYWINKNVHDSLEAVDI